MLNQDVSISVVANWVNASPDTINRYDDKVVEVEKMKDRRSQYIADLDIDS